jgi:membrane protease YdiL (CAAX protease family)
MPRLLHCPLRACMTDDHGEFVLLGRAPNAAIAGLWKSMLEDAGIPAYVPGTNLSDEWAATQRMIGNVGADVFVPRSRLEQAREVVDPEGVQEAEEEDDDASEDEEPSDADEPRAATLEAVPGPPSPSSRRQVIVEVLVVCAVVILPSYLGSIYSLVTYGFPASTGSEASGDYLWDLARVIPLVVFILWVISRSGESPASFGWVRARPLRDLGLAVLLLVVTALVGFVIRSLQSEIPAIDGASEGERFVVGDQKDRSVAPAGAFGWIALVASTSAWALLEELSIRGYLMVRLEKLWASPLKAALTSSLVFAGYHVYQGLLPLIAHFATGLVLAGAFLICRSLWPLVIAHAAHNLLLEIGRAS